MDLAQQVEQYYLKNLASLPEDKQFHFASRLYPWTQAMQYRHILDELEPTLIGATATSELQKLLKAPLDSHINALQARLPYFQKYPDLRGRMLALFRVRHLLFLYDQDLRENLLQLVPYDEFYAMGENLRDDSEAVRVLSTYAINYLYLVDHILFPYQRPDTLVRPEVFLRQGQSYGTKPEDIQLKIYLYTHCIIGETNFYLAEIPQTRRASYALMLEELEEIIQQNFDHINLDNKLEFLVCCRLAGMDTPLFARVYDECTQSLSPEGTFLIDTINNHRQSNKTSLALSEHRNVLFIMSYLERVMSSDNGSSERLFRPQTPQS